MKEQTGIFDIISNIPIVFAYELPKPEPNNYYGHGFMDFETMPVFDELSYDKAIKKYESSRQEWEVINIHKDDIFKSGCCYVSFEEALESLYKNQQVQIIEITPPTEKERGKCKITKIT